MAEINEALRSSARSEKRREYDAVAGQPPRPARDPTDSSSSRAMCPSVWRERRSVRRRAALWSSADTAAGRSARSSATDPEFLEWLVRVPAGRQLPRRDRQVVRADAALSSQLVDRASRVAPAMLMLWTRPSAIAMLSQRGAAMGDERQRDAGDGHHARDHPGVDQELEHDHRGHARRRRRRRRGDSLRQPMTRTRQIKPINSRKTTMPPTNPSSSSRTAKAKSVDWTGRKSELDWLPLVSPFPKIPPDPTAIWDCRACQPAPVVSAVGSRNESTRRR